ncbi:PHD-finger [Popillia japonica]|uniref:PHD-finger n=1 Tax=Popillia japonica TaxID=7064 RepID=A0AAW1L6B9_POPJA
MAIQCVVCANNINRYDDYMSCRKSCNGNFHSACVNISVEELTLMKEDGSIKKWSCFKCNENITNNLVFQQQCSKEDQCGGNVSKGPYDSTLSESVLLNRSDLDAMSKVNDAIRPL